MIDVRLRPLSADDLPLYEAINLDPAMMAELGGPSEPPEGLDAKVKRDAESHAADEAWILVIEPEDQPGTAAGTVSVWTHETENGTFDEIGWMVLPPFQGRGIGKAAVREVLEKARANGRWKELHAFPAVTNAASNAMCRSLGFELVEELEFHFRDRVLRGNHWKLDLTKPLYRG